MKKIILSLALLLSLSPSVTAQWIVTDPTNIATSIVNSANQIVQTSSTVTNVIKNFNEVKKVYEQGKEYYDKLKAVHGLVKDAQKVRDAILMVGDISDIYVNSFQKMMADPNFSPEELEAIAAGYVILMREATGVLGDLKTIVNSNGLSVDDKGRIDIVDRCYSRLYEYRSLTQYYTNKNIGVSWLRAKKANDTDRVLALYGNSNEKYW
ncbi:MAG: DUF4141 domain-containing protein [Alistipes sp.]|jgi:uncharacterized protein YfkK (UPF0435 family)|nr:DUF4141 domain-containing protein [Alistipes sp.]